MTTELEGVYEAFNKAEYDEEEDVIEWVLRHFGIDPNAPAGTCKAALQYAFYSDPANLEPAPGPILRRKPKTELEEQVLMYSSSVVSEELCEHSTWTCVACGKLKVDAC